MHLVLMAPIAWSFLAFISMSITFGACSTNSGNEFVSSSEHIAVGISSTLSGEELLDDTSSAPVAGRAVQVDNHLAPSSPLRSEQWNCTTVITLSTFNPWQVISSSDGHGHNCTTSATFITAVGDNLQVELLFTHFVLGDEGRNGCSHDYVNIVSSSSSSPLKGSNWVREEREAEAKDQEEEDAQSSRYCGDWNTRIKLLHRINKSVAIEHIRSKEHIHLNGSTKHNAQFRAEVRLLKSSNTNSTLSSSQLSSLLATIGLPARCDNQWFALFKGNCYLVSSYPEVSWFTARRICGDIESQLLSISDANQEQIIGQLLEGSFFQSNSDLSRPTRAFWLQHNTLSVSNKVLFSSDGHLPSSSVLNIGNGREGEDDSFDEWFRNREGKERKHKLEGGTSKSLLSDFANDYHDGQSVHQPGQDNVPRPDVATTSKQVGERTNCVTASKSNGGLAYEKLPCDEQAGYVCIKQPLDLNEARNKTITGQTAGTIQSIGHPSSYPNNMRYVTSIISKPATLLVIWFSSFDLEGQEDCLYDWLAIREANTSGAIMCGRLEGQATLSNYTYFTQSNQVAIEFLSDFSNRGQGFVANWQVLKLAWCDSDNGFSYDPPLLTNGSNHKANGTVESPGFPDWVVPGQNCSLQITAPTGLRVLLTLIDFDLGRPQKTAKLDRCPSTQDYLLIDLGQSKVLKLCGSVSTGDYHVGQHILSYDENLTITYYSRNRDFKQSYIKRRGFRLKYDFVPREGTLTSIISLPANQVGRLSSLNYPFTAPEEVDHQMYLKSSVGQSIELRPSKTLYPFISEGECDGQHPAILTISDYFGNISLYPPTSNVWSICDKGATDDSRATGRVRRSSRSQYLSHKNRLKSIESTFHVLAVKVTAISSTSSNSNIYFSPVFQLFYKTSKNDKLGDKSIPLPARYSLDSCVYAPCSENGICRLRKLSKNETMNHCVCKPHWTGLFCHLTLCERKPCGERGQCKLDKNANDYICHCNSGYTGKQCRDTLEKCERNNACRDRGKCALINAVPTCTCHPWYEGKFCERFRYKMQYKPLSQRMLEEPFWLGLIAVLAVLAVIMFVYCIKKMFSERIEKFFAEEIERSKAMPYNFVEPNNAPRYSLTSNFGFSINMTANNSPLPRSRSSVIGKFRRRGMSRGGHMSDSEVFRSKDGRNEEGSDAESTGTAPRWRRFPSLFFTQNSSGDSMTRPSQGGDLFDTTNRLLSGLVRSSSTRSKKERRMSLDAEAARKKRSRFLEVDSFAGQEFDVRSLASNQSETSFTNMPLSPLERAIPTIAEFHVITENSMEDDSNSGRSPPLQPLHYQMGMSNESISTRFPPILKQESEAEVLLKDIRKIQRSSKVEISSETEEEMLKKGSGGRCQSPRPRLSRPPSGFSSSSSESQNHLSMIPEITITTAATIEHDGKEESNQKSNKGDEDGEVEEQQQVEAEGEQDKESERQEDFCPVQLFHGHGLPPHLRRSSVPTPQSEARSQSPGSMSCDTPISRVLAGGQGRKYSLEHNAPKIVISEGLEGMASSSSIQVKANARCDRTTSESNLSTSGYSSLSSPGISRCSSSSPIHVDIHTVVIPDAESDMVQFPVQAPVRQTGQTAGQKQSKSLYGNFLTIPNVQYPQLPHQQHHLSPCTSPKPKMMESINEQRTFIFPAGHCHGQSTSRRGSQESRDEGIDVNETALSPRNSTKRDRMQAMRQQHASVDHAPHQSPDRRAQLKHIHNSRSFEGFLYVDQMTERGSRIDIVRRDNVTSPVIQRQPSWPALLHPPPDASPSSDSDTVDTVQVKERERQIMLIKKFERRRGGSNTSLNLNLAKEQSASADRRSEFRSRSRSPLAFSQSIDVSTVRAAPRKRDYQRCLSSRSLCTAVYLANDQDEASSSSSDSIPSSLEQDDPVTIRSARSCNTINLSPCGYSTLDSSTVNVNVDKKKDVKYGLAQRLLFKMRTHSQSLPASPELPEEARPSRCQTKPATAAASLAMLAASGQGRSDSAASEISSHSERSTLISKRTKRPSLMKQKASVDFD